MKVKMDPSEHRQPPKTVSELGIELTGFRELVNEKLDRQNDAIVQLTDTLRNIISSKADHAEVIELKTDLIKVQSDLKELSTQYHAHELANSDYTLVRKLVYGTVALILVAVIGAIIALVVSAGARPS